MKNFILIFFILFLYTLARAETKTFSHNWNVDDEILRDNFLSVDKSEVLGMIGIDTKFAFKDLQKLRSKEIKKLFTGSVWYWIHCLWNNDGNDFL